MRKFMWVAVASAMLAVVGCKKNQQTDSASAPPPPAEPMPVAPMPYEPMPAPASSSAPGATYTVQKGDTLYGIARRVYGDGKKVKDILAANPSITDPNKIRVGQQLVLP